MLSIKHVERVETVTILLYQFVRRFIFQQADNVEPTQVHFTEWNTGWLRDTLGILGTLSASMIKRYRKVSPMGMIGGVPVGMQMPGQEGNEFNVVQPCAACAATRFQLMPCARYVKTC